MKVTALENKEIEVIMTSDERYIITSCLAYLCHAQTPPAFSVIATAEIHEVEKVLDSLLSVYHVPPKSASEEETQRRNALIAKGQASYIARRREKFGPDEAVERRAAMIARSEARYLARCRAKAADDTEE